MRRLLAAVAVLTLSACINDSIGVVGTQVTGSGPVSSSGTAGTYMLRTVGGASLPFSRFTTIADKAEVLDDALTLTNANAWTEIRHERRTTGGVVTNVTVSSAGTFALNSAGDILFTSVNTSPFNGTLLNGTLTLSVTDPAGTLLPAVYTK